MIYNTRLIQKTMYLAAISRVIHSARPLCFATVCSATVIGISACQTTSPTSAVEKVQPQHQAPQARRGVNGSIVSPSKIICQSEDSGYGSIIGVDGSQRDRPHMGIDYRAPSGTPVYAPHDGKVVIVGWRKSGGNRLIIQSDLGQSPLRARFAYANFVHLEAFAEGMTEGTLVKRGDVIGFVGKTGAKSANINHLHYEVGLAPSDKYTIKTSSQGKSIFFEADLIAPNTLWDRLNGIEANAPGFVRGLTYSPGKFTFPLPCKIEYP